MSAVVVGVDGCKQGWVAVAMDADGFVEAAVLPAAGEVLQRWPEARVYGFDIPIGLVDDGPRLADLAARRHLGKRGSSVFPAPARVCLTASTWEEANQRSREARGKGLPRQSWALVDKIREVDGLKGDPRVVEVHPEVSFALMAGEPLAHAKKTWAGQIRRRRLLEAEGIRIPDELGEAGVVPVDDVLDAAAAAWSAWRVAAGVARVFPGEGEQRDEVGRVVRIVG